MLIKRMDTESNNYAIQNVGKNDSQNDLYEVQKLYESK